MFVRKSINIIIVKYAIMLLGVIVMPLATRAYSQEDFGYYNYAVSISAIFMLLTGLNLGQTHVKKNIDSENKDKPISTYISLKFTLISINSTIFITILYFLGREAYSSRQYTVILLILVYAILDSFRNMFHYVFRARMKEFQMTVPLVLGTLVQSLMQIVVILLDQSFFYFLFASITGAIFSLVVYFYYLKGTFMFKFPSRKHVKSYLGFTAPLILPLVFTTFSRNLGVFFFTFHFGSSAGIYELLGINLILTQVYGLLNQIPESFTLMLLPELSRVNKNDIPQVSKIMLVKFEKYYFVFTVPLVLIASCLGNSLLVIFFGKGYEEGWSLFFCMVLNILFYTLYEPYKLNYISLGRLGKVTLMNLSLFLVSILSWVFLIPIIKLPGIILGETINRFTIGVIIKLTDKEYISKQNKVNFLKVLSAFIVSLLVTLVPLYFPLDQVLKIILTFFSLGLFYILLIIAGIIRKSDIIFIKNTVKNLLDFKYIRKEIGKENKKKEQEPD